jgi:hypothetical protein
VNSSRGTSTWTEQRLRHVTASAELVSLEGAWASQEASLDQAPTLNTQVLAAVRDAGV